jgi:uracil-DNA glycosylase family 4
MRYSQFCPWFEPSLSIEKGVAHGMANRMNARSNPRRALLQRLRSLQSAGVLNVPRWALASKEIADGPRPSPSLVDDGATETSDRGVAVTETTNSTNPKVATMNGSRTNQNKSLEGADVLAGEVLSRKDRIHELTVLSEEVAGCQQCSELAATRTQTVFGVGNPAARLCFFGEAPGADEDRLGEPFVGRAGDLLNKIIEACQMRREDVFIMNVLKCRPPSNRNPEPQEIENCRGFFERQFEVIRPEFICCLGAFAAKTLLDTTLAIGKLRGKFHRYRGIPVIATYHPAYLLRNPSAKKLVWEDMQLLMVEMGIELPDPTPNSN